MNHYNVDQKTARFHILEKPSNNNPFYLLGLYSHQHLNDHHLLKCDPQNGKLWYYDVFNENTNAWLPFSAYIMDRLSDAKDYFNTHPQAENKFDVDKYLKIYQ